MAKSENLFIAELRMHSVNGFIDVGTVIVRECRTCYVDRVGRRYVKPEFIQRMFYCLKNYGPSHIDGGKHCRNTFSELVNLRADTTVVGMVSFDPTHAPVSVDCVVGTVCQGMGQVPRGDK
jgi:hypothetical protein